MLVVLKLHQPAERIAQVWTAFFCHFIPSVGSEMSNWHERNKNGRRGANSNHRGVPPATLRLELASCLTSPSHCGGCSEQQTSLAFCIFRSDKAISYSVAASRNAALHVHEYAKTSSPLQISDCITLKTSVFLIDHRVPKNNAVQIVPTYRCTIDGSQPNNSTISPHDPFSFHQVPW